MNDDIRALKGRLYIESGWIDLILPNLCLSLASDCLYWRKVVRVPTLSHLRIESKPI